MLTHVVVGDVLNIKHGVEALSITMIVPARQLNVIECETLALGDGVADCTCGKVQHLSRRTAELGRCQRRDLNLCSRGGGFILW